MDHPDRPGISKVSADHEYTTPQIIKMAVFHTLNVENKCMVIFLVIIPESCHKISSYTLTVEAVVMLKSTPTE